MRARQLLADVGAPELVGDYRLAGLVRPPRRARQPLTIAQRLQEQQDGPGLRIVDQHVRDLADREVDLVADRDQSREADAARVGARQQRADQAAALADDGPVASAQLLRGESGIGRQRHGGIGAHRADAVGTDKADAGLAHDFRQLVLQRGAGWTGIGEAASQDRRHLDAAPAAIGQRPHRSRAVQEDVGVVDVALDRVEIRVGLLTQYFAVRRINRQDFPRETVLAQEALWPRGRPGDIR